MFGLVADASGGFAIDEDGGIAFGDLKSVGPAALRLVAFTHSDGVDDDETGFGAGVFAGDRLQVTSKIHTQGSDQPRALLAYGMAVLELMRDRSSSVFCPVIIDSPIQQEQDVPNHERIVKFIHERVPKDAQLILGIVDDKGVDFGGAVVKLNDKRRVLREDEFDGAYEEISPFVRAALEFNVKQ